MNIASVFWTFWAKRALKPAGRFLAELQKRGWTEPDLKARRKRRGEGTDGGRLEKGDGDDVGWNCPTLADGLSAYGGEGFENLVLFYNSRDPCEGDFPLLGFDFQGVLDRHKRGPNGQGQRAAFAFGFRHRRLKVGLAFRAMKNLLDLLGFISLFGGDGLVHLLEGRRERIDRKLPGQIDAFGQLPGGIDLRGAAPGNFIYVGELLI